MRDLFLPIALIAVIGTMMFPMHPTAMDFLLIGNLLLAVSLLISTLYVSDPLKLSSLPTMILIATLFRLALNVASTRLILSTGDPGEAIEAFGKIILQGNVVVGAVVFIVITLIQFIVIAKGSERVAEVSARFTLDALPGKQMSIDADVRAGLIDFEGARQKRQELQIESRFYGALDGAMKFIKGDAIAGMVIIVVNVIGGFIVGMAIEGLPAWQSMTKYTVLSVGDGLLSQIPALLNSLAAGMIVTRVSRGDEATLAHEVLAQLGQLSSVKIFLVALSLILACMPGMPALPFLVAAICLSVSLTSGMVKKRANPAPQPVVRFQPKAPAALRIEIAPSALAELRVSGSLLRAIEGARQSIFASEGLVLALPEIDALHAEKGFRILTRGVIAYTSSTDARGEMLSSAIRGELEKLIRARAPEFVDDALTRRALDYIDREVPELVSAVVPGIVSATQLTELLRLLVEEKISIRNFDVILQAVAEHGGKGGGVRTLLEEVRGALRRVITATYLAGNGNIKAAALSPIIDTAFMKAEREGIVLDPQYIECVVEYLNESTEQGMVVVTSKPARRLLRECLMVRRIETPVVAFDELVDDIELMIVDTISMNVHLSKENEERLLEALAA